MQCRYEAPHGNWRGPVCSVHPILYENKQSDVIAAATSFAHSTSPLFSLLAPSIQRRTFFWKRKKDTGKLPENPFTEEALRKKPAQPPVIKRGDLASSSIFENEELAGPKPTAVAGKKSASVVSRNPHTMAAAIDPDPDSRKRWQRKMVIKDIKKRGRLTRTQEIKREERELLSKSHNFKTSTKKLGMLARQIQGKTVEEALVQMRFSVKKAAKDVKEHLEFAKNEAIVRRGMGLGAQNGTQGDPVNITTKDGKRLRIEDKTRLYVDQAWVGKGDFTVTPDHRARGQINMMKNPTTSKWLLH